VFALWLHLQILVPLLVVIFSKAKREEAERAEEVDVGFESVPAEQLPAELPPLDDTPPPTGKVAPAPTSTKVAADKKPPPPPDKKAPEPPPPTPVAVTPPPPVVPPPPPKPQQPPPPKGHEKIVDLENDKKVEPPPNAKYLAQDNSRTEEETRATHTNLEREQAGEQASSQAAGKRQDDKEIGDDRAKIAELDEQRSKLGREAPQVVPHQTTESLPPDPRRSQRSPVLSLREVSPRGHEITPETVDPSLPHDPAGMLARERARSAFRDDDGGKASQGKRVRLALSGRDYEYLFGAEAKAERQLAQKERSSHLGRPVQRRLSQVRSSLENFIPDVKPGTKTVLNARRAPFAAFIARVHRQIHKYWGYGALEDWDGLPSSSPFNNDALNTTLEIVINQDGTVGKITVVKASGYLAYDAAAIDAVFAAGPFPEPPGEILSSNGKVYFHWNFARDGRACGTEGVEYFILDHTPDDRPRGRG